jgi:hypothetical protein
MLTFYKIFEEFIISLTMLGLIDDTQKYEKEKE